MPLNTRIMKIVNRAKDRITLMATHYAIPSYRELPEVGNGSDANAQDEVLLICANRLIVDLSTSPS